MTFTAVKVFTIAVLNQSLTLNSGTCHADNSPMLLGEARNVRKQCTVITTLEDTIFILAISASILSTIFFLPYTVRASLITLHVTSANLGTSSQCHGEFVLVTEREGTKRLT